MVRILALVLCVIGCRSGTPPDPAPVPFNDTTFDSGYGRPTGNAEVRQDTSVFIGADRDAVVQFAKSLAGIPYKYASSDPAKGFDCSGFITYVYSHFSEKVPRSSVDFTNLGREVTVSEAQRGDLILFTGTDTSSVTVGHMGIVVENNDSLRFIHSSSGKAWGVTITPLNEHYKARFVKVIDMYRK